MFVYLDVFPSVVPFLFPTKPRLIIKLIPISSVCLDIIKSGKRYLPGKWVSVKSRLGVGVGVLFFLKLNLKKYLKYKKKLKINKID